MRDSLERVCWWTFVTCITCMCVFGSGPATAQQDAACRDEVPRVDKYEFLRAASLDLRGVVPTIEEYEALADLEDVPMEWLEEWTRGEAYAARVVRRHRALLWSNVSNLRLLDGDYGLSSFRARPAGEPSFDIYLRNSGGATTAYRGRRGQRCDPVPAIFDAMGQVVCETRLEMGVEVCVEGYVMVTPYWAPEEPIAVCAFDAQTAELSASEIPCAETSRAGDPSCGCGENMKWCSLGARDVDLRKALAEDVDRRVAAHVIADEPYYELLSGRRAFLNGPLQFWWTEQAQHYDNLPLTPGVIDEETAPDMDPTDWDTWEEITLPEHHSGLLTSPVFLLRFQTNRARADRFYDAFLCQPFQPPAAGLPVIDDEQARDPDLQTRAGCNYCHALLEPAAAHWGRWMQQGGGYLDPDVYEDISDECRRCGMGAFSCSSACRQHYLTRTYSPRQEPYLGMLRAYEFLREEHYDNVEMGPAKLVREAVADDRFPQCSVRRTAEWLFGRGLRDDEAPWVSEVSAEFYGGDFRYRELSLAVVGSETYRRVR